MSLETLGAVSDTAPVTLPALQPDKAVQPAEEHCSYTTRWDTTRSSRLPAQVLDERAGHVAKPVERIAW